MSYCVGEYNKPNDIKSNGHESWSLVCKKTVTDITLLIKAANSNVSEMGLCNMIIGQMLPSIYMYDKLLGVIETLISTCEKNVDEFCPLLSKIYPFQNCIILEQLKIQRKGSAKISK